jgi:hypothetical protein
MIKEIRLFITFCILTIFITFKWQPCIAQENKNNYLQSDTITFSKQDTVIYILDTIPEKKAKKNNFYDKIKNEAYKRKLTKEVYRLLFRDPDQVKISDTIKLQRSEAAFEKYKGKKIRKISIRVFKPFGSNLSDTSKVAETWIERTGNKLHHKSRASHLKKRLHLREGDLVNPFEIADNERLIRQLPYIRDAIFIVHSIPTNDQEIDLELLVKDQFSWGLNANIGSLSSTSVELYNRNLYGIGHEANVEVEFDSKKEQKRGYDTKYRINNIYQTYINATLNYQNTNEKDLIGIKFNRDFETFTTKHAGSIEAVKTFKSEHIHANDPVMNKIPLDFNYTNLWYGRSFQLKRTSDYSRKRFVVAGRLSKRRFFNRPVVSADSNQFFHNSTLLLNSLSVSKIKYYKSNLIYNFGRTEDIPYGYLAQIISGYEDREFSYRYYLGLDFQKAIYLKKQKSYFFNRLAIGGFFNSDKFEQGTLIASSKYFSKINQWGTFKFRNFISLNYTIGIRRFANEYINLNKSIGINGFKSDEVKGKQRLTLNCESVAFTPYSFGGFRVAIFSFADLAFIGSNHKNIFAQDFYSGFGIGFRLNNENLVFKTIQFRFAFYPNAPSDFRSYTLKFAGEERPKFNNFMVTQPEAIGFE